MFLLCLGLIGWQTYQLLKLQTAVQQTQIELEKQSSIIQSNQSNLQHVTRLISHDTREWDLMETDYLIKLADINLIINDNIPLAIKLLQNAQKHITGLNDPSLMPLRQALSSDINTLQSTPKVDLWETILRLETLSNQIAQTPVISTTFTKSKEPIAEKTETKITSKLSWRNIWQTSLQKLKSIFIIQHYDHITKSLPSPEQQIYMRQKIQLLFEQAQWAVLHKQPQIYLSCLQNAHKLINIYLSYNPQAAKNASQAIEELQKINIKSTVPNISASIQASRELLQQIFEDKTISP
jgi:uroporphyrin-3 C-methyltransferase